MIPKTLHIIWVGDDSLRPDNCIQTWVRHNPGWQIKLWGNDDLVERPWINATHMQAMLQHELNGVADMMRWEILYAEGGFVVDADSVCLRPLDDSLLQRQAFACWESEIARPGLIAAGYFACQPGDPLVGRIVADIHDAPSVVHERAWVTVGPQRLTDAYRRYAYHALDILPSHLFMPEHFTGLRYQGTGTVYAHQEWASTRGSYDSLHRKTLDDGGTAPATTTLQADTPSTQNLSVTPSTPSTPCTPSTPSSPRSPLESRHAPYFVQRVQVGRDLAGRSRIDVFAALCTGKRVLHVGCADWPITDPAASLHVALQAHCALLDGFDIHADALAALAPHVNGRLFSRLEDIHDHYDLVLVPEVLEHVSDVAAFLAGLNALNSRHYLITVPDAYQCRERHFDHVAGGDTFVEIVHPDHNCWYTPFTLSNVIAKYTPWTLDGLWFFNGMSLLAMVSKPVAAADLAPAG